MKSREAKQKIHSLVSKKLIYCEQKIYRKKNHLKLLYANEETNKKKCNTHCEMRKAEWNGRTV